MSRKKGSKNSLAKGLVWTSRVCTTLIVTTDGPTRWAAATIAVRREAVGSCPSGASCADAGAGVRSPRVVEDVSEDAPRIRAPRRRNPHRTPQNHDDRDPGPPRDGPGTGASADDIHMLLGKPPQPGIADPHEVETVRGRRRLSAPPIARRERRVDRPRSAAIL